MVSRVWRRILSLHFCQEFVYLRAKTSKKQNQILRSTRAAFRALQQRSWTLLDLDSMYSEQDPRECSVEQADIDLGQIQVEAASTQPFNFEGLSNDNWFIVFLRTNPHIVMYMVVAQIQSLV